MPSSLKNRQVFIRLIGYIWRYKGYFLLGTLSTLVASGIAAGFSWFLRPLINKGFVAPNLHFIHWIPAIVIAAYIALGLTAFLGDTLMALVARHVVRKLQCELFDRFLTLPVRFFDEHPSGQLLAMLIYNIEQVTETCTTVLMTISSDGFYLIGLVIVMFVNSWQLTIIFLMTVPAVFIIFFVTSHYLKQLSLKIQDSVAEVTTIAEEALEGLTVVREFGAGDYESSKFTRATANILKRQVTSVMVNSVGISGVRLIASFAIAFIIYLATKPHSMLSIGAFMSIIAAMLSALKPLRMLTEINSNLQKGLAGAETVFEILDEPVESNQGHIRLARAKGAVEFQQVDFQYPLREKLALSKVNFKIEPGEKIALVGHSGSGKSTVIKLLQRFYLPQSGQILLDGIPIEKIELLSLRAQFSVVSENIILVNDTLLHNIAYGRLASLSVAQISSAIKAAHLENFINELPKGLDTPIGENGLLLSAGQRQRVAIARAILKDAPILVLDEATSRLDMVAEYEIHQALDNLMKNRTTIIVSHRASTVQYAHRVFKLFEGELISEQLLNS